MTSICEKFLEEITSGSGACSDALSQHLAVCSSCRETFAALGQLQKARKPVTGKEAAAIAGILKAVQIATAAPPPPPVASPAASSLVVKSAILALCVLSVLAVHFWSAPTEVAPYETPVNGINTVIESQDALAPVSAASTSADVQQLEATGADVDDEATMVSSVTEDDAEAVSTANQLEQNSEDVQNLTVAPDEEEIK